MAGPAAPGGAFLEFRRLGHRYAAHRVIDELSLGVAAAEVVCLLGPSGCGKTTTLRLAAGFEPVSDGEIWIGGRLVATAGRMVPPERRGVGIMFQDYALFPHLTVADNVGFGIDHLPAAKRRETVGRLLDRLQIGRYAGVYPHSLSAGEQQRVALARALAPRPGVMLLDEPFSGLDSRLRVTVREETLAVLREWRTATLLVTHDPEEAMRAADRIALMRAGRLEQVDTPDRLYCAPVNRFVAEFFGELNAWRGRAGRGCIDTPFGCFAAGQAEGTMVDVLLRPEGIRLCEPGRGIEGVVLDCRSLGASWLVDVVLPESGLRLRARTGRGDAGQGQPVGLAIDPARAFVFPAETA
ncbi:MAG: ABC transporter ATP-binding protein [Alphaproteobacteria bacterium]|nr:ABC transporter ATP-binding protein [Alphaproteobacteria bacterium]